MIGLALAIFFAWLILLACVVALFASRRISDTGLNAALDAQIEAIRAEGRAVVLTPRDEDGAA